MWLHRQATKFIMSGTSRCWFGFYSNRRRRATCRSTAACGASAETHGEENRITKVQIAKLRHLLMVLTMGALGFAVSASPSQAASIAGGSALGKLTVESGLVQVQSRACQRRYRTCRYRWGYGRDYRRCMRRVGCSWRPRLYRDGRVHRPRVRRCGYWRDRCAENRGFGNNDYRGCLRYYTCL
jgi:hypothetical protein